MKPFILILFIFISHFATARQNPDSASVHATPKVRKDTRPLKERISLGGSTGFWINLKQTHVEVSPLLAYHFPKILTTGAGYRYIYTRDRVFGKNLNTYGPNLFARTSLTKRI